MTLNELIKTATPMMPFGGRPGFGPQFGQWPPRDGFAPITQTQFMPRTAQSQTANTPMQPQEPPKTPQMQQYEAELQRGANIQDAYNQVRQQAFSPNFNQGVYDRMINNNIAMGFGKPEEWQDWTKKISDEVAAKNKEYAKSWNMGVNENKSYHQQIQNKQNKFHNQTAVSPEAFGSLMMSLRNQHSEYLYDLAASSGGPEDMRDAWVGNLMEGKYDKDPRQIHVPAVWKPQPVATQTQGTQPAVTQQPANQGQNDQLISAWNMIAPNIPQGDQVAYSQAVDGLAQHFGMSPEQVHQAISSHIAGGGVTTTGQQGGANGTPPGAALKTTGSGSTGKTNGSNGASRPTGQNIGMMDWAKQNPTLAAGIGALLVGALSLGIGGGGSKKDSSLGLILALLLGGGTFLGLKGMLSEKDVAGKTTQALDDANS